MSSRSSKRAAAAASEDAGRSKRRAAIPLKLRIDGTTAASPESPAGSATVRSGSLKLTIGSGSKRRRDKPEPVAIKTPRLSRSSHKDLKRASMHDLYELILRKTTGKNGRKLCVGFMELPNDKQKADWDAVIDDSIDLNQIGKKLNGGKYKDYEDLIIDLNLMLINARTYFDINTTGWRDACKLTRLINQEAKNMLLTHRFSIPRASMFPDHENELPSPELLSAQQKLIKQVKGYKSKDGYILAQIFMIVPSEEEFPDYHEIMPELVDIKLLEQRVNGQEFGTMIDLVRAFDAMFENAVTYNPVDSEVYIDALELQAFVREQAYKYDSDIEPALQGAKSYLVDLKEKFVPGEKNNIESEAAKRRRLEMKSQSTEHVGKKKLPLKTALRGLFNRLCTLKSKNGEILTDSFQQAPSKKEHPEFHKEISNPIDLTIVSKRINNSAYKEIDACVADFHVVFANATKFYPKSNKLHQYASALLTRLLVEANSTKEEYIQANIQTPERVPAQNSNQKANQELIDIMMEVYNYALAVKNKRGEILSEIFMVVPDKREYPDYYEIISEPLDFETIEMRIKDGQYGSIDSLANDFNRVFKNAQIYNEQGSPIWNYSCILKSNVAKKLKAAKTHVWAEQITDGPDVTGDTADQLGADAVKTATTLMAAIDEVRSDGKPISSLFEELPSRQDEPKYHLAVSTPIDLASIRKRSRQKTYASPSAVISDFFLLFSNALVIEEPDSMRFSAAQKLLDILSETAKKCIDKQEFMTFPGLHSSRPPLYSIIRELLDILESVTSDSGSKVSILYAMLPERKEGREFYDLTPDAFTLARLKEKLYQVEYYRLDTFVEDVNSMFRDARTRHPVGDEYKSLVSAQKKFIKKLAVLMAEKEIVSPASSCTLAALQEELDTEAKVAPKAKPKKKPVNDKDVVEIDDEIESHRVGKLIFVPGEYVYFREEGQNANERPDVYLLRSFMATETGQVNFRGIQYLYPEQTQLHPGKTFYEKEVFRTSEIVEKPTSNLVGKCWVLSMKQYCTSTVAGHQGSEDDIYICESRYDAKTKTNSKLRNFNTRESIEPDLLPRKEKLESRSLPRVQVTAEGKLAAKDISDDVDSEPENDDLDDPRNVKFEGNVEHRVRGATYYSMFYLDNMPVGLGDVVLVRSNHETPFIAMIEQIWIDSKGLPWFHGFWFMHPRETHHAPTRTFYENEVVVGPTHETNSLFSVLKKAAVFHLSDFVKRRPLALCDEDVYVCESKWVERGKHIQKIKSLPIIHGAVQNEVYELPERASLHKVPSPFADQKLLTDESASKHGASTPGKATDAESKSPRAAKPASKPAGVAFPKKNMESKRKGPLTKDIIQKDLKGAQFALGEAQKKVGKNVLKVMEQTARLKAIEVGGDGTEVDLLENFDVSPNPMDAFDIYAKEQRFGTKDELRQTWRAMPPTDQAPYMARAAKLDSILRAAFQAGSDEKKNLVGDQASDEAVRSNGIRMGNAVASALSLPNNDAQNPKQPSLPAPVIKELQRNPTMVKVSKRYQDFLDKEGTQDANHNAKKAKVAPKMAPVVCLDSAVRGLRFLEKSLNGDVDALRQIFADI